MAPVQHIVMLKFKPKTSHRVIETIADKLRELPSLIKEIQGFSVQTDLGLDPARNHDLAAVALFDSAEDYEVYATHPAHLEVIKLAIVPILAPGGRSAVQIPFNPDRAEKEAVKTEHVQTTTIMSRMYDLPLLILYAYFIFSCTMIETSYCAGDGPMDPSDTTFMMPETYDFSTKYNPLFLARPYWLKLATCFSAYGFLPFHTMLFFAFLTGWNGVRPLAFVFAGVKLYALGFYHTMEYTSATPPPELLPYWAPEGPYIVALAWTLYRMRSPAPFATHPKSKVE
mmetsp:Transcript_21445/g.55156  ORF Transcript_21445/g.55156 Transcript_21445/m.55156 type:complete len:284 (+) Transcript_21445:391-1242(+)